MAIDASASCAFNVAITIYAPAKPQDHKSGNTNWYYFEHGKQSSQTVLAIEQFFFKVPASNCLVPYAFSPERSMITVIAEFKLPQPMTRHTAQEIFLGTAPKYQGMPGLIRKYYFLTPDGIKAGGIYLWRSREDADNLYTDEWKAFVRGKYGSDPVLTYLDTPVVVDNVSSEILSDPKGEAGSSNRPESL